MPIPVELIDGTVKDAERILAGLTRDLFPEARRLLNDETLPVQFSLFKDDVVPTNQRNLTDVRTRMGVLLEYELGKAITRLLPDAAREKLSLTYVIANRYPDLAFRGLDGSIGVRFEVKSIEAVAEEKAASFDTLIKDVRKGTDFVVVMLWEWRGHRTRALRCPHVYDIYVMDAYQLAQMRDCRWLNSPPAVGPGRQGYDLTFGVNCKEGNHNQEEGNYGKLMRIFDEAFEEYLPDEVKNGTTLKTYYTFRGETIRAGLEVICGEVAEVFAGERPGNHRPLTDGLPVAYLAERPDGSRLLVAGDAGMPRRQAGVALMLERDVNRAVFFNGKFSWKAVDRRWNELESGNKPSGAKEWAAGL
jgi:hypothetical protein